MKLRALLLSAAFLALASPASASLTVSEKAQVRDFVARGRVDDAGRVRALVVRTDLTTEESVAAVTEALTPVSFDDARRAFVRELVFGSSSAASRPPLALAATKGLLARADGIYQRLVGGLDHEPRAIAELWAIYAFLDAEIANAGRPTALAHDPGAGIPSAVYEECSKALRDHVERNARWLKGDGAIPESVARLRAQAQIALVDMLPDGLIRRVEAADRLGIGASRKKMLAEWGVLFADAGKLDDAKAERVRQALASLPGARVDLAVLFAGEDRGPIRARGLVAHAGAPGADASPWPADGPHDPATSAIVLDLASLAAKRALDNRGELRLVAERDSAAAQGDANKLLGRPRAPSVDHAIGAAIQLLVLDAPRAVELASSRFAAGKPESAALLSDAIGALAVFGIPDPKAGGPRVDLARPITAIQLAPNGAALGFTIDGYAWTIDRAPAVTGVKRAGSPR